MSILLSLALALPCPQGGASPTKAVVVLQSGEELAGEILAETPDYVEVRISGDTTIGLQMAQVREIRRTPADSEPAAAADTKVASAGAIDLGVRDQWYVLHDGEGRAIGTLHESLTRAEGGELRFAEEWDFAAERGRTQVTRLEVLKSDGAPLSCFYHERSSRPGERLPRDERLVRGEVRDGHLVVVRTDARGTDTRRYAVGPGLELPLAFAARFRQRPHDYGLHGDRLVYDAAVEELQRQTLQVGSRRRVPLDGAPTEVREIVCGVASRSNLEWLDATGRTVRREVNGPALVAVRVAQATAQAMAGTGARAFAPAVAREASGRFALWLPNPIWEIASEAVDGQITANAPLYAASFTVLALDQLGQHAHLDTAADAVERWLALACGEFRSRGRDLVEWRSESTLRIEGTYVRKRDERRERCEVTVFVVPTPDGGFVAACFSSPIAVHEELAGDFERVLHGLELHRVAVAAEASSKKPKVLPR